MKRLLIILLALPCLAAVRSPKDAESYRPAPFRVNAKADAARLVQLTPHSEDPARQQQPTPYRPESILPPIATEMPETYFTGILDNGSSIVPPVTKRVLLSWAFSVFNETPDLVFRVHHSGNLSIPLRYWPVLTNVPGTNRSIGLKAEWRAEFFSVTASNRWGESPYATK